MDIYVKVNGNEYPASIMGRKVDNQWDGRESKTIRLSMDAPTALNLFSVDTVWSIVVKDNVYIPKADEDGAAVYDENGQPVLVMTTIETEYDNREYCVPGPVIDYRDGTIDVKMGKYTTEEILLMEVLS